MRATVITDASWCGQTGVGGWAAWVRVDGVTGPIKRSGPFRDVCPCSRIAEIRAAVNGLVVAATFGASTTLLQSDCQAVIHGVNRYNDARAKEWDAILAEVSSLGLPLPVTVTAKHVKGHTRVQDARSYVNRWCDVEARRHMRAARKGVRTEEGK